ncbi:hypothetical protein OSTOST_04612, partial [Ostertagia ostertagi]
TIPGSEKRSTHEIPKEKAGLYALLANNLEHYKSDISSNLAKSNSKISAGSGTSGYADVVVDAEDEKVTQWHGSSDAALEDEPFYHGYMARAEAEKIITKDGEFLVRKAEVRGRETPQTLIRYHMALKEPVYNKNVILKSYITTGTLLGHGAFGEVYKGTLTVGLFTKPIEVAVKTLKSGTLNSDDSPSMATNAKYHTDTTLYCQQKTL